MKALVVFCHPKTDSFAAAVFETVKEKLDAAGIEYRVSDLYRDGFNPVLAECEFDGYMDCDQNIAPVRDEVAKIRWCDTLIFVYPTWWYGLPAMLKGWLDRVLLPGVAFHMPDAENADIRAGLHHITRLAIFTTGGASPWLTFLIGSPGRKTLARGVGFLCAPTCRKIFKKHYNMDQSTARSRATHLAEVAQDMDRLLSDRQTWRDWLRHLLASRPKRQIEAG